MDMMRILVVDDFEPYRELVVSLLDQDPGLEVVGEASDGLDAVAKAQQLRPDLILMDIGLPKLDGLEAARRIVRIMPESKIVFLTQEMSPEFVQAAFKLGASGYVIKQQAKKDLSLAVIAVLQGSQFTSSILV
jgi:DNA-binding NarL/FixJ family response regulator